VGAEIRRLLCRWTLTSRAGAVRRGKGLDGVIGTLKGTEPGTFDVFLAAFRPGRGRERLDGIEIVATRRSGRSPALHLGEHLPRGDFAIRNLRAGARYRLEVYEAMEVKPLSDVPQPWAVAAAPQAAAALGIPTTVGQTGPAVWRCCGGLVELSLERIPKRGTTLSGRTEDPSLANATVQVAFISPSDRRMLAAATLKFAKKKDALVWGGKRTLRAPHIGRGDCHVFVALAKAPR
jgi:hypothetical protein